MSMVKHGKILQFSIKPLELKNNLCAIWYQAFVGQNVQQKSQAAKFHGNNQKLSQFVQKVKTDFQN